MYKNPHRLSSPIESGGIVEELKFRSLGFGYYLVIGAWNLEFLFCGYILSFNSMASETR